MRVNVKSLAAESRFIRREMKRAKGTETKNWLAHHRTLKLREEARVSHLLLAYLRGRPYRSQECSCKHLPLSLASRIAEKASRVSPWWVKLNIKATDVVEWMSQ